MAAPASLPDAIEKISGVIPLSPTLGLWQSMLIAALLILVSMTLCYYSAPGDSEARGMKEMGVDYQPAAQKLDTRETPGEWLEYSPLLTIVVSTIGFLYLIREVATSGPRSSSN